MTGDGGFQMMYLLTLGWPWFAGALALGALVGFFTFTHTGERAGGWIVGLGVLALAAGGAVSVSEIFNGRDAALFDIGYMAAIAYAAGLPLGGFVKSFGGAKPGQAPAIETPEPTPEPAPLPAETLAEAAPLDAAPELVPVVPDPVAALAPAPPRAKPLPGVSPETLLGGPRDGAPDDLARIKGIGPKSLEKLNALGVFHYDQIAAWNLDNAKWIGAAIGAPGRVERDKWIQQARVLAGAGAEQK
jgi:predicted flap endonuclease-1-like 5' DNA nuclease